MLPKAFSMVLFSAFSVAIAIADIRKGELPRIAFAAAFPVFFALRVGWDGFPMWEAAGGFLTGLAVFLLAAYITGGMLGLADVWYSALIGLVLGPRGWYAAISIACVCGMAFLLAAGQRRIPFIPLMAMGCIAAVFLTGR